MILIALVARFNCKIIRSIRSNVACAGSCTKTRNPSRMYPLPYITAHPEFTEVFMPSDIGIIFKFCKYPFTTPVPKTYQIIEQNLVNYIIYLRHQRKRTLCHDTFSPLSFILYPCISFSKTDTNCSAFPTCIRTII